MKFPAKWYLYVDGSDNYQIENSFLGYLRSFEMKSDSFLCFIVNNKPRNKFIKDTCDLSDWDLGLNIENIKNGSDDGFLKYIGDLIASVKILSLKINRNFILGYENASKVTEDMILITPHDNLDHLKTIKNWQYV